MIFIVFLFYFNFQINIHIEPSCNQWTNFIRFFSEKVQYTLFVDQNTPEESCM